MEAYNTSVLHSLLSSTVLFRLKYGFVPVAIFVVFSVCFPCVWCHSEYGGELHITLRIIMETYTPQSCIVFYLCFVLAKICCCVLCGI